MSSAVFFPLFHLSSETIFHFSTCANRTAVLAQSGGKPSGWPRRTAPADSPGGHRTFSPSGTTKGVSASGPASCGPAACLQKAGRGSWNTGACLLAEPGRRFHPLSNVLRVSLPADGIDPTTCSAFEWLWVICSQLGPLEMIRGSGAA